MLGPFKRHWRLFSVWWCQRTENSSDFWEYGAEVPFCVRRYLSITLTESALRIIFHGLRIMKIIARRIFTPLGDLSYRSKGVIDEAFEKLIKTSANSLFSASPFGIFYGSQRMTCPLTCRRPQIRHTERIDKV